MVKVCWSILEFLQTAARIPLYFRQQLDSLICEVIKAQVQLPEAAVVRPQSRGQRATSISCHFTERQPTEIKQVTF